MLQLYRSRSRTKNKRRLLLVRDIYIVYIYSSIFIKTIDIAYLY